MSRQVRRWLLGLLVALFVLSIAAATVLVVPAWHQAGSDLVASLLAGPQPRSRSTPVLSPPSVAKPATRPTTKPPVPPPCARPRPALKLAAGPPSGPTAAERDLGIDIPDNRVILSFDDSGTPVHVGALLDTLEQQHVGGLFPVIGNWAKQGKKDPCAKLLPVVGRMRHDGFMVINHSWDHPSPPGPRLVDLPDKRVRAEIQNGVHAICFRPPGGSVDRQVRRIAAELGQRICYWTYDTNDWVRQGKPGYKSADQLVADIAYALKHHPKQLHGGVILAHMLDHSNILAALPRIIALLRAAGIEPCGPVPVSLRGNLASPLVCV